MYTQTRFQTEQAANLEKQGFRFSNWISAQDGNEEHGCMVMTKRGATRFGREYREIAPDGSVN